MNKIKSVWMVLKVVVVGVGFALMAIACTSSPPL